MPRVFVLWLRHALVSALVLIGGFVPSAKAEDLGGSGRLTVFAAASLKGSLDAACLAFTRSKGLDIAISYAASPALAKQIEQSAPADVFISADLDWMDYLERRNLIAAGTRANLFGNRLVLVAPAPAATSLKIERGADLAGALGSGRLAIADVAMVPAGKYARAALENLGAWAQVQDKLAPTENVRSALAFVARGEAPLGIVYNSDAVAEPNVRIAGIFPDDTHPRIVYPGAVVAASRSAKNARDLITFLQTPEAQAIFEKAGYVRLN